MAAPQSDGRTCGVSPRNSTSRAGGGGRRKPGNAGRGGRIYDHGATGKIKETNDERQVGIKETKRCSETRVRSGQQQLSYSLSSPGRITRAGENRERIIFRLSVRCTIAVYTHTYTHTHTFISHRDKSSRLEGGKRSTETGAQRAKRGGGNAASCLVYRLLIYLSSLRANCRRSLGNRRIVILRNLENSPRCEVRHARSYATRYISPTPSRMGF